MLYLPKVLKFTNVTDNDIKNVISTDTLVQVK